ncbi:MAG: aldo/keto reductase [Thermoplasmata archaeon]|nr:aldo/keto reductase [Thermoplasmata archaeon]
MHPPYGFGLWALGRWTKEDEARTRSSLLRALEKGVPWLDTAEVYGSGRSERMLGDALSDRPAGAFVPFLTTKVSWEHLRAAQVRASIQQSLHRLARPSVDVYLVHAPDPHVPIGETMGAMELLWKSGKVGAIGVSNFTVPQLEAAQAALPEAEIVVNQVRFNLLDREEGEAIAPYCRKHGIVIEAYTPLARGLLAGRYLDREKPSAELKRYAHSILDEDHFAELRDRARSLRELAREAGVPLPSIALHWLSRQGVAPLFGASQGAQVDELLEAWAVRPSDAVLDRADAIVREGRA